MDIALVASIFSTSCNTLTHQLKIRRTPTMEPDWELSQSFTSDGRGIRVANALTSPNGNGVDAFRLVTGNQGGGLCQFGVPSGSIHPIEYQHNHAITALLSTEDSYVTGCKDAQVRIFDASSHALVATLTGHEKPVTSLAWVASGNGTRFLVSGSWDGTAKIWNLSQRSMVATLPGHENSVCVVGLTAGTGNDNTLTVATGSAGVAQNNVVSGHTVRIWTVDINTGQVDCAHKVANDHDGPIRGIAALPNCIATCSNDGTVKLRASDTGACISTLTFLQAQQSHPPMLLSVATLEDASCLAASAEDGHVVVWSDIDSGGGEPQVILHPSCVWNVIALPNGDLATCCQDGILRIFTRSTERYASSAEREEFAMAVQESQQKQSSGPSAEEVAKLPLWEANSQKRGTSEGQVQLFNKGGKAVAAQWSVASQTWIEVGEVVGSNEGGNIDGKKYDHVFPIEVDQTGGGVASLQLGYNNGENPFVAAQRFIDDHVLPQYHLNDIADYIQQRAGRQGTTLGDADAGGAFVGGITATAGTPMASYQHLPAPSYKSFELPAKSATTTLAKMKKKLEEFGKLSESQLVLITSLIDTLAATNRYHASKVSQNELAVIAEMLDVLSVDEVFPALDLARLTTTHPDAASSANAALWTKVMSKATKLCEYTLQGPASVAVPMLSLRLFANAFRGGPGTLEAAVANLQGILTCAEKFVTTSNKNVRLSVATVLYNVSYYLHSKDARAEIASHLVSVANKILSSRAYEGEAVTRTLVALGTTSMASPVAKESAKSLFIQTKVEMAASPHGDVAKATAKEVYVVLA